MTTTSASVDAIWRSRSSPAAEPNRHRGRTVAVVTSTSARYFFNPSTASARAARSGSPPEPTSSVVVSSATRNRDSRISPGRRSSECRVGQPQHPVRQRVRRRIGKHEYAIRLRRAQRRPLGGLDVALDRLRRIHDAQQRTGHDGGDERHHDHHREHRGVEDAELLADQAGSPTRSTRGCSSAPRPPHSAAPASAAIGRRRTLRRTFRRWRRPG